MDNQHEHAGSGIMCGHVFNGERPLRLIEHCPGDTWNFMCGETDHDSDEATDAAVVVCHNCAMKDVALPLEVQLLPLAHLAEYSATEEKWHIRPLTEEEILEFEEE